MPTAIKVYNWLLTLWRGDIHLSVPMLFTLAFILTFLSGGLTGLFLGNVSRRHPAVGHLLRRRALPHGDGRGAACWSCSARISPLVPEGHRPHAGRPASGGCHFWITFLGTYLIYFPMHYLGVLGMPQALLQL